MTHTHLHAVIAILAFAVGCGGKVEASHGGGMNDGGTDDEGGSNEDSGGPSVPPTCGLVVIEPPILTVTDSTTGKTICDAVSEGDGGAELYPCSKGELGCTGGCQYTVTGSATGSGSTFSVEVGAPGYGQTTVSGLETRYCGCDEMNCQAAQQVSASLVPVFVDAGPTDAGGAD
jgi:hypothetical protein